MDPITQKLIEHLRSITLSDTERAALRSSLIAKMREGVPSPWSWLLHAKHTQVAFLLLVIIIGYGSTITLAAESSFPGDILYPIKTRVNEPLARIVTATSPAARATFETGLLEKRLQEVEILDIREKFDPKLKQSVRRAVREQNIRAEKRILDTKSIEVEKVLRTIAPIAETVLTNDEGGKKERDSERALRKVLEKHKRIIEKLELDDEKSDIEETE